MEMGLFECGHSAREQNPLCSVVLPMCSTALTASSPDADNYHVSGEWKHPFTSSESMMVDPNM